MTKYISDIKTIEETGYTGIRITVSEDSGSLEVRAVNTEEFNELKTQTDNYKNKGITTDNLKEKVDALKIDAATLEGYVAASFMLASSQLLVGRIIKNSEGLWDYSNILDAEANCIEFPSAASSNQGLCLIIQPGAFTDDDKGTTVPLDLDAYNEGNTDNYQRAYMQRPLSLEAVTYTKADGTKISRECLVAPMTMGWDLTKYTAGRATFNFHGKSIARIWKVEGSSIS